VKKRMTALVLSLIILFSLVFPAIADTTKKIMVVPLEKTVEKGLSSFVQRAFNEAEAENVDLIIVEIDTPGGRIDAAKEIKDVIMGSNIPTVALVKSQALSAGSYIALACDTIAMQPGSTLGDAEPRIGNERADEKTLSAWKKELAAVAEAHNRDPKIAEAFADRDIVIEGVIEKGKLLTLTPNDAIELGMADYQVANRNELLTKLGLENAQIISADPTGAERISRIVTNPYVAPILLTIGIAGIIIEVLTVGFGLFGVVGILSLILFFGGHLIAGFSGWEAILLFVLGLILMIIEAFSPGFGIFGIGGLLAFITSIFLVTPSFEAALISLTVAIIGTIVLVLISMKFFTTRNVWKKLVLGNKLVTEEGFVASREEFKDYSNREGTAITILRPAGTMELDDGTRLDVVTSGEFVEKDSRIKVIKVEGNRIIVKKID
jgi:membrane-bound serine protease (ClpP class)